MKSQQEISCWKPAAAAWLFLTRALLGSLLGLVAVRTEAAVAATLTPASIVQSATTTLQITGLATGSTVQVERWMDANSNGSVDAGEPLAEVFQVTDGQWPSLGGVRNLNQPGDADSAANGQISVTLSPWTGVELGRAAGSHLLKLSSPTAAFTAFTKTLAVTQAAQSQTISGTVTNGGIGVPYATVIALSGTPGNDGEMAGGAITNASGSYSLNLPAGTYLLAVFKTGIVGGFGTGGAVSLGAGASVTRNLTVVSAPRTISGKVSLAGSGAALGGVQVFVKAQSGNAIITSTGLDGTYSAQVTADSWVLQFSSTSFSRLGCLDPVSNGPDGFELTASTVSGSVTGMNASTDKATALLYGFVKGPGGTPVVGLPLYTDDGANRSAEAYTDSNGNYAIGILAGTWHLNPDNESPALAGYLPPQGESITLSSGQAVEKNFTLAAVNAHLAGTVTKNGTAVSGLRLGAYNQDSGTYVSALTTATGAFDLGLNAGNWSLQIENDSGNSLNVIGPSLSYTLAVNQTISGIAFAIRDATATISGTVRDDNNQGIPNASVYASATISGTVYQTGAQTDANGSYSMPAAIGTWSAAVNADDFPSPAPQSVVVSGANVVRDFNLSRKPVIWEAPYDQSVQSGQSFVFSISSSGAGETYRWQVSTDGGTNWSNLSNNGTYSATDTNVLGVNASLSLNGYRYRCVVTNSYGSTNSGSALLNVTVSTTPASIIQEPAGTSTSPGVSASFSVVATGSPAPSYQWQLSTDSGFNWGSISDGAAYAGTTGPTLAVLNPTLAQNGHRFRVLVTNSTGSDTSVHAVLTVTGITAFDQWLQANFSNTQLADPAISGPLATPAGDGVPNLYKYAFNLNPLTQGYGGTLTSPFLSGNNLVLVFPATRSELTYQVKASTDLVNWTVSGVNTQVNGTLRTASYLATSTKVYLKIFVTQP